jgi:hypothetical protein
MKFFEERTDATLSRWPRPNKTQQAFMGIGRWSACFAEKAVALGEKIAVGLLDLGPGGQNLVALKFLQSMDEHRTINLLEDVAPVGGRRSEGAGVLLHDVVQNVYRALSEGDHRATA